MRYYYLRDKEEYWDARCEYQQPKLSSLNYKIATLINTDLFQESGQHTLSYSLLTNDPEKHLEELINIAKSEPIWTRFSASLDRRQCIRWEAILWRLENGEFQSRWYVYDDEGCPFYHRLRGPVKTHSPDRPDWNDWYVYNQTVAPFDCILEHNDWQKYLTDHPECAFVIPALHDAGIIQIDPVIIENIKAMQALCGTKSR